MEYISKKINQFAIDLFNELRRSESNDNRLIAPLGASLALSLLLLGSRGNTAAQIRRILHLSESETELKAEKRGAGELCGGTPKKEEKIENNQVAEVHKKFQALLQLLQSERAGAVLKIANAVFAQLNFPISEEYVRSAEEFYQAKVKTVDFGEDKTRQEINSWVEEKTNSKIKDLFPENSLDKSSSLILVNAVYFKGLWKKKFNEKNTINAPFYLTKDSQKSVPMMSQTEKFNVGAIDEIDALIIELPYEANDLSMFMILPNETDGLQKVEDQMTQEALMSWTSTKNMASEKVELQIPRFKMEKSYNLDQSLKNMGMVDAFSQQKANLSGISDVGQYVSKFVHKCFIEVNEEGTEAAAATAAVIVPMSAMLPRKIVADHPFLAIIIDISTGVIIFHAAVYSP
ncbi:serpin B4-like [Eleutherodactylus coqui]|uniref:serpin B4-like n=1 Tax=Eleutherodactylus coqui TaxID=57060 RepID=UPI003461BB86